jgi:hypothetical protein
MTDQTPPRRAGFKVTPVVGPNHDGPLPPSLIIDHDTDGNQVSWFVDQNDEPIPLPPKCEHEWVRVFRGRGLIGRFLPRTEICGWCDKRRSEVEQR